MKQKSVKISQSTLFIYKSIKGANSISLNKDNDTTGGAKTTMTSTGFYK